MLNRPEYKSLVKLVRASLEEQKASSSSLIAITMGHFSMGFRNLRDFEKSWPKVMKELDLIDDKTGTHTYTLKGHGFMDIYVDADEILSEVSKHRK